MADQLLVVDDEPGIRALWKYVLSTRGYEVREAEHGQAALEAIGSASFDVVISDLRMPGLSGIDVLKAVRERAPGTEVIITTGYADLETAIECVRAGAFDLLQKPCQLPDLLSAVERALLKRRARVTQMVATDRLVTMGQMAAGVAHEINNPLAYLQSNHAHITSRLKDLESVQLLVDNKADAQTVVDRWREVGGAELLEDVREAMKDASEGATRIRDIATDLRTMSRSEEQEATETVDLKAVVQSALRVASGQLKQVKVHEDIPDGLRVTGMASRLSQVFLNLLVNAAQAMRGQTGPMEIHLSASRRGDQICASVEDTGPGISAEHASRLFEAFFTTKKAGEGTGLGLSISREILRRFGGDIHVECGTGLGARFEIALVAA